MTDKDDKRDLVDRRILRFRMVNLGKTALGEVDVTIPEGTHINRLDKDNEVWGLLRPWKVRLPVEILYKPVIDDLPEVPDDDVLPPSRRKR
ncbi:unnamed protein product [marine sediment metagenome]|uniref:Uncharacterized protein n=1 Tax=marine sediment metagenome TaxID=412755 RepID=X0SD77_9ZZZZ